MRIYLSQYYDIKSWIVSLIDINRAYTQTCLASCSQHSKKNCLIEMRQCTNKTSLKYCFKNQNKVID
jgi:hypothetical protein